MGRCLPPAASGRLVLMLPWATMVERGTGSGGLAMRAVSSTSAPPTRCRAEDTDVTAGPDKPATITLATMERLASLDAGDAVKMQIDAQQRRQAAVHMQERGDRIGPKYELAEAKRLEHEAELTLDPAMHCTGPVSVGNGGEMVFGTKAMRPFVNTVTERPGMLAIDASRQRMELAGKANVLELGLDAAQVVRPPPGRAPADQEEADRVAQRVDQGVDLGAQSAARAPER
jgi:hypothetical protein